MNTFGIIGGGLAGSLLAYNLLKRGTSVLLFHQNNTAGSTASRTPLALANIAAAKQAKVCWNPTECLSELRNVLDEVTEFPDKSFYHQNGIFRPAFDEDALTRYRSSFENEPWPENTIRWMSPEEAADIFPVMHKTYGGLFIPNGITVNLPEFLDSLHQYLMNKFGNQLRLVQEKVTDSKQTESGWQIVTDESTYHTEQLVFASGEHTARHPFWKHHKLHPVKGQIIQFSGDVVNQVAPVSVAASGYFAVFGNTAVMGSTYEHHYKSLSPDEFGKRTLLKKLSDIYPALSPAEENIAGWASVRVTTPDKLPFAGAHHEIENLHLFTGLGSRGLLYAPLIASHLADHLLNASPLPPEVDVQRLYQTKKFGR